MRTTVEPLDGNKIKLSVEVGEDEIESAVEATFRKMAREVRIPGFRPGKVPRRVLEARVGAEAARQAALQEALPAYYAQAVKDSDIDVISSPQKIDITAGEEAGALTFDAVVEVRPRVEVPGYEGLKVVIPSPHVTDADVDLQIDRLREQFGELHPVGRPARDGDHVTIDIKGTRHTEEIPSLSTTDFLYEVGSGTLVTALDEHLRGAKVGDIFRFNTPVSLASEADSPEGAEGPDGGGDDGEQEVTLQVLVKDVKEKTLPELTDEWASEASEFDTLEELKADIRQRAGVSKRVQVALALRDQVLSALVELVTEEPPSSLVAAEMERRLGNLVARLRSQGATMEQYMKVTGTSHEQLIAELSSAAVYAVKADLALRAVGEAQGIKPLDDDIEAEIARRAEQLDQSPAEVRHELEHTGQMTAVRSDVKKQKAFVWLVDHVEIVDEEGQPVDRADLLPTPERSEGDQTGTINHDGDHEHDQDPE